MNNHLFYRVGRAVALASLAGLLIVSNAFSQTAANAKLAESFASELKLVEGLKVYNSQLLAQIKAQDKAKKDIAKSIRDSKDLEPRLVPLIKEMQAALKQFVKNDLPFHKAIRLKSLNDLEALMVDPKVQTSDRFRGIMDIYTVEMEYGNTFEAYADTQTTVDGSEIEVDMLRVGRLALYYQTKDGKTSGMWDKSAKQWTVLPSDMNRHIRKAIKVAAKQIAPELMNLPISAPEGA